MAKGDSNDAQTAINTQGGTAQNATSGSLTRTNNTADVFGNLFNNASTGNLNSYNGFMGNYNFANNPGNRVGAGPYQAMPSGFNDGTQPPPTDNSGNPVNRTLSGDSSGFNGGSTAPAGTATNVDWTNPIPGADWNNPTPQQIQQVLSMTGQNSDPSYWQNMWQGLVQRGQQINDPQYALKRLLGYESGGTDVPSSGPYAAGGTGIGQNSGSSTNQGGGPNNFMSALGSAIGGYGDFAQNGGFTDQQIADLRARAIAPTRAVFANAVNKLDQQRALQGGYSPNYTAALAKNARDLAYTTADTNTNANASIAQLIQQGKLYGLGGLANTGLSGLSTLGNLALGAQGQTLTANQLQNQLGLGLINAQINKAGIPGNFQSVLGNIGSILGLGGSAANALGTLGKLFGGGGGAGGSDSGFGGTSTYQGGDPFGGGVLNSYDPLYNWSNPMLGYPNDPSNGTGVGPGIGGTGSSVAGNLP